MNITDITIDKEFENLIRPLAKKEREELRVSLSRCGLLSPLIVWKTGGKTILVDGHNRLSLWKEHKGFNEEYELKTHELPFSSKDVAKEWIIKNQLGRRNLSPDDFKLLVGQLYEQRKTTQGGDHGNQHSEAKGKVCTLANTAEQVAAETGVSPRTVKSAGKLAAKVEEIQEANPEAPRSEVIAKAKEEVRKPAVEISEKAKEARAEAEADSPKLWALKSAWKRAGKRDIDSLTPWAVGRLSKQQLMWMADCVIEATPADMLPRILQLVTNEIERRGAPR